MKTRRFLFIFFFLIFSGKILAGDSLRIMQLDDYYRIILNNHPVAKQAATFDDAAKAELRIARGMLDPKAEMSYGNKTLTGTEYYQIWDNSLKVPVWWGTDVKVGYEQNSGQNINPETQTPDAGLWYVGISVPLGQGLLIDERRKTINQSKLLPKLADAERVKIVNKLLLEATKDYWDWYFAMQRYRLFDEAYLLAENRFEAMKIRVAQGDLPAIDTVEALIAVQDRDVMRSQAMADFKNMMLRASVHLWNTNGEPIELNADIIPAMENVFTGIIPGDSLQKLIYTAHQNHPDLIKLDVKAQELAIENRYQRDKLKPKAAIQYNLITKKLDDLSNAGSSDLYTNNYKVGVSFSYPIFLRQERGKIQLTEIKMRQNELERIQREREISTEIETGYNNWVTLESQIGTQQKMVSNAVILRDGEQQRFNNGESSFFLVNTRELALINSQVRLAELQVRYAKNKAQLYWAAGTPLAN